MLIDWFTVGAQTLNFLILVWLMQRFLYRPVLRAIDARERRIAQGLAEADQKKAEAQKEREEFRSKNEAFERQRAALLGQMAKDVEAERLSLLETARKAADTMSAKRMETLRSEARELRQAIGQRAQQEVFAIARKTLADLAATGLEERVIEVFVRQLRASGDLARAELTTAAAAGADPVLVRTAFDLPEARRAELKGVFDEMAAADVPVRFETAPDLVSGIDLVANGRKISWNIAAYLQSLEVGVGELLDAREKPEGMAAPKPEESAPGAANT
ncbi:MAG TPA: F0F1 ATP synthase subunit B [Kiritimatiellia bacterium]|nr:F0F1 ATP synthase subunit B [Kiritimatiellia bacterium]HPS08885.1 F0F1 ATP synthase subunit B [Kiritimatiellia bacterium]